MQHITSIVSMWNKRITLKELKQKRTLDYLAILLCFILPFMIYWSALSQNHLMITGDGINFFAPKFFQYDEIASGEIPLWNSYVISGISLIADPNNTYFYPLHALALIFSKTLYTNLYYLLHIGLAGLFTYLFLKANFENRVVALAGALIFSSSVVLGGSRKEHGWVYTSIIWMPAVLYLIKLYLNTSKPKYIIYSSLAMAIQFTGGNPQLTLYSDLLAFAYFSSFMLVEKFPIKKVTSALITWIGGFLLFAAVALIPMGELIIYSMRANVSQIFCLLSSSWELLVMTVFPTIFGTLAHPLGFYKSAEVSIELYLGIIPLIYAIYAICSHLTNRLVQFSLGAATLAFLYSSACNVPYLGKILQHVPLLNFFRVQSRILFIFVFFLLCCFALGFADILNPARIKRLATFNGIALFIIGIIAAGIIAWGRGQAVGQGGFDLLQPTADIFLVTFIIAAVNLVATGGLNLLKNKQIYLPGSAFVIIALLSLTLWDIGRFSWMKPEVTIDSLMDTQEVEKLSSLLKNEPYRMIPVYDDYNELPFSASGLTNNWSMVSHIRNLKGRTEFENPRLNELLGQSESRDIGNISRLLTNEDILSMLSVKYVLMPKTDPEPQSLPREPEEQVFQHLNPVDVPGNGELFVSSFPVNLEIGRYYQVSLEVDASEGSTDFFYVDLYGGPDYDRSEQQQVIPIRSGIQAYNTILYSGEKSIPTNVIFRIVTISNTPLRISNIAIVKLKPSTKSPDYSFVADTDSYNIYKLSRAQKLLYIPTRVESILDDEALRQKPEDYPNMDQVSYIKDFHSFDTNGQLEILKISNNHLTARITSSKSTFVNHAQSFYPGWKAYVDGKETPLYLVNGVIQGAEVPPGDHLVEFVYDPLSLKIGAGISISALILALIWILRRDKQ